VVKGSPLGKRRRRISEREGGAGGKRDVRSQG